MDVDLKFTIVAQNPTVEFLGGTQTRNVVTVGFITDGHGIYGEARVIASIYSANEARHAALGVVVALETVASLPNVAGVEWGQSVNKSGLLVDQITVTVESDSGDSTALYGPVAISALGADARAPEIAALAKALTDAEGPSG